MHRMAIVLRNLIDAGNIDGAHNQFWLFAEHMTDDQVVSAMEILAGMLDD